MTKITYNLRWMLALLLAGVFSIWTPHGWQRIGKAFGLWFGLLRHPEDALAAPDVVSLRLATCEKCVVFFKPLRTCGTPVKRELRKVGCLCYMPEAAKLNDKRCFLDESIEPGYPGGWQDAAVRAAERRGDHRG